MSWERGREVIDRLLRDRELDRVTPNAQVAERLLADASAHIASARLIAVHDPAGAYQLGYDAARKAAIALLAVQGLRATSRGGHVAAQEAVQAQFGGAGGHRAFGAFGRLRRRRNDSEYPNADSPTITRDDADDCLQTAAAILDAARGILDSGALDGP
jgi:hypothetical protein